MPTREKTPKRGSKRSRGPSGRNPNEPLAHFFPPGDPHTALCGQRLKGIPARKDVPLCVVCRGLKAGGAKTGVWGK